MNRILPLAVVCLLSLRGLYGAANIQLDANESLFVVLAAINAAGYDDGSALPDNSPVRREVRDYLSKRDIAVLPELRGFYRKHSQRNGVQDLAQYISFALVNNGPPDFSWRYRDVDIPPDVMALADFTPLLVDFYREANLEELWARYHAAFDRELEKYHTPLVGMTSGVDAYLRTSAGSFLGRNFRVYIDLLAAPEHVQTRNYLDDSLVVATASETPRLFDIRHSYLHFEIDPIVIKYGAELDSKRSLLDLAGNAPLDPNFRNDFVLLATESLIKTVESRLDKNPAEIDQAARQGYILAPFFAEELPLYEKQEQGLRYYFGDMVKAIDLQRESARIAAIRFDAAPLVRAGRQVTLQTPQPELSPSGATLEKAEDLYLKRSLDQAKELYLTSLQQQGSAEEHAQAWYGLARIAVLQNQPDAAVKLFEKTLGASPDAPTKAWALVYLARLSKASGDPDRAAKFYQDALTVPGASGQALKAAQNESKNIPK